MTIDASKLEGWASVLQVAKNGLGWYRNEFPETYSTSDDKVRAWIDEALASMAEELEVARGEVMVNGMTEAETSASASVVGLTCGKDHAADVAAASADDMKVYDGIAAGYHRSTASAIDPKKMRGPCGMATSQHEGRRRITLEFDTPEDAVDAHSALIGMGWPQRSIKSAQDGGEVLACLREIVEDCDVEFSDEQWRRYRATISKALGVDSRCNLHIGDAPSGAGRVISPEIVNQIAAQAGFGPAAAWPEFSGTMQRFFSIAFRMGVQDAMACRDAARTRGEL